MNGPHVWQWRRWLSRASWLMSCAGRSWRASKIWGHMSSFSWASGICSDPLLSVVPLWPAGQSGGKISVSMAIIPSFGSEHWFPGKTVQVRRWCICWRRSTALLKIMGTYKIFIHSEAIEQGSSIIFHRGPNSANKTKVKGLEHHRLDSEKSKRLTTRPSEVRAINEVKFSFTRWPLLHM